MAMRSVGKIIEDLLKRDLDQETRRLVKELNNTYGTKVTEYKENILGQVMAESEEINGKEYVSADNIRSILLTADSTL